MAKTITINLGNIPKVHATPGDTFEFETDTDCTIEFSDPNCFGVPKAPTKNKKLKETVVGNTKGARVTTSAATVLGSPIDIVVP